MALVTVYDACVFPTPNSWKVMTKLKEGATVICAGCPKVCDGDVMVPIQPRGWVDIVDLKLPRKPSAPTRPQPEAKGPNRAPTPTSAPAAEGKKAKETTAGPEVWTKEKEEPGAVPEFMRQASRLAMDVGDTAKEYVKSGYSGSAMVASEAIRMAQAAGEQAPWLAGEAVRMASEAAGMVWGAAATAFQRLPSDTPEQAPEPDESHEHRSKLKILTMMGFDQDVATASLERCSSIEAAVEYMMETSTLGSAPAQHGILPVQAVGQTFEPSPALAAGAAGQHRMVERVEPSSRIPSIHAALIGCGFAEEQAKAAARRCSSVEAAVEWIAAHPDVKE